MMSTWFKERETIETLEWWSNGAKEYWSIACPSVDREYWSQYSIIPIGLCPLGVCGGNLNLDKNVLGN